MSLTLFCSFCPWQICRCTLELILTVWSISHQSSWPLCPQVPDTTNSLDLWLRRQAWGTNAHSTNESGLQLALWNVQKQQRFFWRRAVVRMGTYPASFTWLAIRTWCYALLALLLSARRSQVGRVLGVAWEIQPRSVYAQRDMLVRSCSAIIAQRKHRFSIQCTKAQSLQPRKIGGSSVAACVSARHWLEFSEFCGC